MHTAQNMGSTTGRRRRLGQGVKRVWPVALIGLLSVAWTGESGADPDHQRLAAARPANHVPGGINLGLTGLPEQEYAARVLEHKMHDNMKGGFTEAAVGHFGGGLDNESVALAPQAGESVSAGALCPASSPVKSYDLSAINVEITLNAYHDFFPGYMYVPTENIGKVRAEEKKNEAARKKEADPGAITSGLSGDVAIQPLVIRANQGDCLRITLTNKVDDEDVGLHIHGSSLLIKATGAPATQTNPDTVLKPGKSQSFEWYVKPDTQEGARQFHSHTRDQSSLGLMGVLVVEPKGSVYLDPHTGGDLKSGWLAMIADPNGPDFREFVVVYSEAGNEETRPLDKKEEMIPQRDTFSDNYRPSSRLLNYRSESFFNRMVIQQKKFGFEDESMGYSAYTFGDVGTPVPRSYVGDPAKWRLVHAGSEAFHSHHLHGGAIRWRRQPLVQNDLALHGTSNFALGANGPVKFPPIQSTSDRVDVQSLGPSETFTKEIECGTGGCQHLAGDFLYHCHIPHHYVAGMWAYWRSYNTLQIPGHQTDSMAPLQELPDRKGRVAVAVDSTKLVGSTVHWFGKSFTITDGKTDTAKTVAAYNVEQWVAMMLPAPGKPGKTDDEIAQTKAYDASVLDWTKQQTADGKLLYLNEPETTQVWPAYKPPVPGARPPFLFDTKTGKLAWPHLKPHLGKRPPFAPTHNGAPWAEPIHQAANGTRTAEPAHPGENGPWSLCPAESSSSATMKKYVVNAITLPITLTPAKGNQPAIVDKKGQLYVNAEEEAAIRADDKKKIPLVLRANVGDCVDIIFKSKLDDNDPEVLHSSKVNMHIHFVQFDTQASDGVITGMSYEQSVRPFTQLAPKHEGLPTPQNTTITTAAAKGKSTLTVADASRFHVGTEVGIGMDKVEEFEIRRITATKANTLTFHEPLSYPHQKGEIVSVEFVRYRWYVDSDFGMTFWHDHAFGLTSWAHGLFGGLVAEPRGSTYHDPVTGKEVRSGNVVDIHTNEPVSAHIRGSFREMVPQIMDDVPRTENRILSGTVFEKRAPGQTEPKTINKLGSMDSWSLPDTPMAFLNGGERTTGSALGLRVEPLGRRLKLNPDPSQLFSSSVHGDPATMQLRAYVGDPIVVRALEHSANDLNTFHIDGHWFPLERFAKESRPRNTVHMAIAERYDLAIPGAGGPQQRAGDYLFYNGRSSKLGEGSWGIIRVFDQAQQDLLPLPGHERFTYATGPICPAAAPVKRFSVVAIDHALNLHKKAGGVIKTGGTNRDLILENKEGKIFALEEEVAAITSGAKTPHPLTLHVNTGDCIQVNLTNRLTKDRASFHPDLLAFDPHDSYGVNAGKNRGEQTVAPGQSRLYTFYAHPEYKEATALIRDWGNPLTGPRNGLYGAIVIGPKGSTYRDPVTKADVSLKNAWQADVLVDTSILENATRQSYRDVALFFQDEDNVIATAFMPYIRDAAGLMAVNYRAEPLKWRVKEMKCAESTAWGCAAAGDPSTPTIQAHVGDLVKIRVLVPVSEQNMTFSLDGHEFPLEPEMPGSNQLASAHLGATETFEAEIVAGGEARRPGDYLYMNHRMMYAEGGQWGLLRVLAPGDARIAALPGAGSGGSQIAEKKANAVGPVSWKPNQ